MLKNILVPIDFRVESLNTLKQALEQNSVHEVNVVLVYAGLPGNALTDLLFYSERDVIRSLSHPEFEVALSVIKSRFEPLIRSLSIQLLQGNNRSALDGLLRRHNIAEVYVPKYYPLGQAPNAFDPVPLLRTSPLPVYEVSWVSAPGGGQANSLASLFNISQN